MLWTMPVVVIFFLQFASCFCCSAGSLSFVVQVLVGHPTSKKMSLRFSVQVGTQWLEPFLQVSTAESGYVVRTPQVPDSMKFHGCGKSNF